MLFYNEEKIQEFLPKTILLRKLSMEIFDEKNIS